MRHISDCMKRHVVTIGPLAQVRAAVDLFVTRHIGLLPVAEEQDRLLGMVSLRDMLGLVMPVFVNLIDDVDFVHDFGAVELLHPSEDALAQPVTAVMRPAVTVPETCGLLRAYVLMRQRDLHDLIVVDPDMRLVGIASRVDIATAVLAQWQVGKGDEP